MITLESTVHKALLRYVYFYLVCLYDYVNLERDPYQEFIEMKRYIKLEVGQKHVKCIWFNSEYLFRMYLKIVFIFFRENINKNFISEWKKIIFLTVAIATLLFVKIARDKEDRIR